ncbi:hypothetical protein BDY24DRAFT_395876 [Mrakia frigida]|uniref:U2 snRNP complex subunit CUS1 n=1 Tax=Mrakia frigida TaxID=29902 RepID=UPI003FCC0714
MPPPSAPKTNGIASDKKSSKPSRNQLKREKKKAKKASAGTEVEGSTTGAETETESEMESELETPSSSVKESSPIDEFANLDPSDPALAQFSAIFERFQLPEAATEVDGIGGDGKSGKGEVIYSDDEDEDEENEDEEEEKISKKKQRKLARLTVADLKTLVSHPEVIEWTDPTARDPRLLVELKSYRNTIPVPGHWSAKRDYLQSKRGMERPPFQLPSYIADTGIATQRDAIKDKEKDQSLKQKTRERVQPKMGKIDIDYQKLHDAFFRFQTKPKMSAFGEVYYEGKELEADVKEKRPGDLSAELIEALSIPPLAPPPWLIAMQRFGPPPSYPSLRVPGLNAPIPAGAQWGFHPGGWGKPPVDEYNRPIYGDVFGVAAPVESEYATAIDHELWGELEPEEEDEDEEESDEESEQGEELFPSSAPPADGLETPSGTQSIVSTVPGGLETPEFLDIRKERELSSRAGTESVESSAGPAAPKQLYQVIEERQTNVKGFMGSERGYDVHGAGNVGPRVLGQEERGTKRKAGTVDLSLDPEELAKLSKEDLAARYEAQRSASSSIGGIQKEDFSDMVAEEMGRKRAKGGAGKESGKKGGKGKEREEEKFKF